ncbi:MAG: ImmA/IrrE family metallo-endopeptidase [Clostridia bacterium]|nr:ImmA/IrrE family metallo-endopeptidase [Clostridia bacterium]
MGEIFTRLIKMPPRIKGYTAIDDDGNYNIYLNEKLSAEQQRRTYLHEMAHIKRGDWDKDSVKDAEEDM